jgi:hypothetical protein
VLMWLVELVCEVMTWRVSNWEGKLGHDSVIDCISRMLSKY